MTQKEFERVFNNQADRCGKMLLQKAKEYATEDRLHNFKVASQLQGTTPIRALGGMLAKHTISIFDMIEGDSKGESYSVSMWDEKITDHINYLILLRALIEDAERDKPCIGNNVPFSPTKTSEEGNV